MDLHDSLAVGGMRTRLVGGMAVLLWAEVLDLPRGMTKDIDCALLRDQLPDQASADDRLPRVDARVRALGFARPSKWKPSRSGRFGYAHRTEDVVLEFLCGRLPFGRMSRRRPAKELARVEGDPPSFYAAEVAWMDLVSRWIPVEVHCGPREISVEVPDLPGQALLKLKAVRDKQVLLEQVRLPERVELEKLRLQRHAGDLLLLLDAIDDRGRFDELAQEADGREVRNVASHTLRWLITRAEFARTLGLHGLEAHLARWPREP